MVMKTILIVLFCFYYSSLYSTEPQPPRETIVYPHYYQVFITDVYDGDTVTANIKLGFGIIIHNQRLRLYGINTPEVRGPEKPEGIITRDRLREIITHKMLIMDSHKDSKGKYGRWLATLWLPQDDGKMLCINKWIIEEGLGKPASY